MTTPLSNPPPPAQSRQARAHGRRSLRALLCRATLAVGLAIILMGASSTALITHSQGQVAAATFPTLSISPTGGTTGLTSAGLLV